MKKNHSQPKAKPSPPHSHQSPQIIGLTGSIASGKSTVSQMIRKKDIPVICADLLARKALDPHTEASQKVRALFGKEIILRDGSINRKKLANLVFGNKNNLENLNSIVHPEVLQMIKDKINVLVKEGYRLIILDIPLLFEAKLDKLCDKTVVVYSPHKQIEERLQKRNGYSAQEIQKRIASQIDIEKKKTRADFVIDNSGTLEETRKQVKELLEHIS